jgi:hypothetical protein
VGLFFIFHSICDIVLYPGEDAKWGRWMACQNCGSEKSKGDRCSDCGAVLDGRQNSPPPPRARKKNSKTIFVIIAIVVTVALVATAWYAFFSPQDEFGDPPTPVGAMPGGTDSSGSWRFSLVAISQNNVRFTDCSIVLSIGGLTSARVAIPASLHLNIPISGGNATGYDLNINDVGSLGYLSAGTEFVIGPVINPSGNNAYQPPGTQITFQLCYDISGGVVTQGELTL